MSSSFSNLADNLPNYKFSHIKNETHFYKHHRKIEFKIFTIFYAFCINIKRNIALKFKPNDQALICKYKKKTEKVVTPKWTEELFAVDEVNMTNPVTYSLRDLRNDKVLCSFYQRELVPAIQKIFRIEKVIKRDNTNGQVILMNIILHNSLVPFGTPGCLRSGLSWINCWISFAPEFQYCYFCESSQ